MSNRWIFIAALLCAAPAFGQSTQVFTPSLTPGPVAGCGFDPEAFSFAGNARAQALCLLRPNRRGGELGMPIADIPAGLGQVGQPFDIAPVLVREGSVMAGLPADLADTAIEPVSRADSNNPAAPTAKYFVIHDTSTPYLADAPFPAPLDSDAFVNRLTIYAKAEPVAHMFIARDGALFIGHDYSEPWRATKLEKTIGTRVRGLFLHNELVQPRRADPAGPPGNDLIAPAPGFSAAQYQKLAALYVLASARAGVWLIPAYHSAIDDLIPSKHDDPQNFDLDAFAAAVRQWRIDIAGP
ncbi:MAG: hypothetical protein ACOYJ6_12810 [Caulobacterales bacterium]|jgi:hypothetical protein